MVHAVDAVVLGRSGARASPRPGEAAPAARARTNTRARASRARADGETEVCGRAAALVRILGFDTGRSRRR